MDLLDAPRIRLLLREFIDRLGATGEFYDGVVIGGAALTLEAIPNRRATQDVDTFGQLSTAAQTIIAKIAERESLPLDWLNNKAQFTMSPLADTSQLPVLHENRNARLRLMDVRTLLALKLRAGRPAKDADDIRSLLDLLEVATLEEATEVVDEYWGGEEVMADNARVIVARHLDVSDSANRPDLNL